MSEIFKSSQTKFVWIRLFNLYGENEDPNSLYPYIKKQISNNKTINIFQGNEVRDYMNVIDASKDIADISVIPSMGVFNVCSGVGISVFDFAAKIALDSNAIDLLKSNEKEGKKYTPKIIIGIKTLKNI